MSDKHKGDAFSYGLAETRYLEAEQARVEASGDFEQSMRELKRERNFSPRTNVEQLLKNAFDHPVVVDGQAVLLSTEQKALQAIAFAAIHELEKRRFEINDLSGELDRLNTRMIADRKRSQEVQDKLRSNWHIARDRAQVAGSGIAVLHGILDAIMGILLADGVDRIPYDKVPAFLANVALSPHTDKSGFGIRERAEQYLKECEEQKGANYDGADNEYTEQLVGETSTGSNGTVAQSGDRRTTSAVVVNKRPDKD